MSVNTGTTCVARPSAAKQGRRDQAKWCMYRPTCRVACTCLVAYKDMVICPFGSSMHTTQPTKNWLPRHTTSQSAPGTSITTSLQCPRIFCPLPSSLPAHSHVSTGQKGVLVWLNLRTNVPPKLSRSVGSCALCRYLYSVPGAAALKNGDAPPWHRCGLAHSPSVSALYLH